MSEAHSAQVGGASSDSWRRERSGFGYGPGGRAPRRVRPRLLRPFPAEPLRRALAGKRAVAVLDQDLSLGMGGVLHAELAGALHGIPGAPPVLASFVGGLGGRDVGVAELAAIFDATAQAADAGARWKLIEHPSHPSHHELYDLELDPRELDNVYASDAEAAGRLRAHLEAAGGYVDAPFGGPESPPPKSSRPSRHPATWSERSASAYGRGG